MLANIKHETWKFLSAYALALTLAACASGDQGAARAEIGNAQTAMGQAQKANASEFAPLELATAEEQLTSANQAFDEKDYVKADHLAERAAVNAELAEAKAETSRTKGIVKSLQDSIDDLRQEIDENADVK